MVSFIRPFLCAGAGVGGVAVVPVGPPDLHRQDAGAEGETLGQRVDSIGEKVESIATKVDAMATSAKTSVEVVGAKAQGVATGAEALGLLAGKKAAAVSEYMVVGTLAYRLITKLMASRAAKSKKA